jgi:hypothetical protein
MNIALYRQRERNGKYYWFDEEDQLVGKLIDREFTFKSEGFKKRVIRHCRLNQIKLIEIGDTTATLSPISLKKLHKLSGV